MAFFKKLKSWGLSREREPELTRSQYSLVSCGDLTAGALQLWLGLPEEVKHDHALAPFRQYYEKENDKLQKESVPLRSKKRLPSVNSAPLLNDLSRQDGVGEDSQNGGSTMPSGDAEAVQIENGGASKDHHHHAKKKLTKWDQAKSYTKISLLVGCWAIFTVIFCMYNEKDIVFRSSVILPGKTKDYILNIPKNQLNLQVTLSGPFIPEQIEKEINQTEIEDKFKVEVWLERWVLKEDGGRGVTETGLTSNVMEREISTTLAVYPLLNPEEIDFSAPEERSAILELSSSLNSTAVYVIRLRSDAPTAVPLALSYKDEPLDVTSGVLYAGLLMGLLYAMIIFEVINRTLAAIMVSTLSLAVLTLVGERPSLSELVSWLDVETLIMLLSMMILVAIMAETGMFDVLAVYTFEKTKGSMWPLISSLFVIAVVLALFLDNVTTVLLITPITIKLCEVMEVHPIPVLMAVVVFSNVGGTATPVGDPPNVIIASNPAVRLSGIHFTNFSGHMSLGILFVCIQTYIQWRIVYWDVNKLMYSEPRDVKDLRRQLNVWRRAADSLPHMSQDELAVKDRLEQKVTKLSARLDVALKERKAQAYPKECFQKTLTELKQKYKIRDKGLLVKSCVAINFVVIMFFLHALPEFARVSMGFTALLGAILLLVLADREDLESILHRVEWSTLLFFAALFVLMEALTKLGLIDYIGGLTESLILKVDEGQRLAVALLLILWISGITSAFVDNVPLTVVMVRVVTSIGGNPDLNLPLQPLIWALSFGVCLGGNGTLIGASANVVCAGVAEQHGYKITFTEFFKIGFPLMIGHLVVASAYLLLCHCVFSWH